MSASAPTETKTSGVFYHIYNKGIDNKIIFKDNDDYATFLRFLREYLTPPNNKDNKKDFVIKGREFRGIPHQPKNYFNKIKLIAFNLNPNHFHLVLQEVSGGSSVAFMRSLPTRYSIYFNRKYQRRGSLFEGPYKSAEITTIPDLLLLTSYLHQEKGFSSLPEYLGVRSTSWIEPESIISYLSKNNINYQNLIKKHSFDEKEKELLSEIIFEDAYYNNFEQNSTSKTKLTPEMPESTHYRPKTVQFFLLSSAFVILLTFGLLNIQKKSLSPTINLSQVLSGSDSLANEESTPSTKNLQTTTPLQTNTDNSNPAMIKVSDGPKNVNIFKNPSESSEVVARAYFGEIFELVEKCDDWCEIKLANGLIGFIPSNYIEIVKNNN